jgi:hypothetical protein
VLFKTSHAAARAKDFQGILAGVAWHGGRGGMGGYATTTHTQRKIGRIQQKRRKKALGRKIVRGQQLNEKLWTREMKQFLSAKKI